MTVLRATLQAWRRVRLRRTAMSRGLLVLLLALAFPRARSAGAQVVASPPADSVGACRSPAATLAIALIPGALVHGAGHLYAGDVRTARWLALSEAAGYAAMFTAHARGADRGDDTHGGAIVYGVGAGLFFGSWLYDILAAPTAARARCATDAATDARWRIGALAPRDGGVALGVARRF